MQSLQLHRRTRNWQRFWPKPWLIAISLIQSLVAFDIIGLEIGSMILNVRYSFFFIGFMASFFFVITWISTFIDG